MEREPHPKQTDLTGIHINLVEHAIEYEDQHGTIGRLLVTGETVLYEGHSLLLTPTDNLDTPNVSSSPWPLTHRSSDAAPISDHCWSSDRSPEQ